MSDIQNISLVDIIKQTMKDFDWFKNTFLDFGAKYMENLDKIIKLNKIKLSQIKANCIENTVKANSYTTLIPNIKFSGYGDNHIVFENLNSKSEIPIYVHVNQNDEVWIIIYGNIKKKNIIAFKKYFEHLDIVNVYILGKPYENILEYLGDNTIQIIIEQNKYNSFVISSLPKYLKNIVELVNIEDKPPVFQNCCNFNLTENADYLISLKINLNITLPKKKLYNITNTEDIVNTESPNYITNFNKFPNIRNLTVDNYNSDIYYSKQVFYCFNINTPNLEVLSINVPLGNKISEIPRSVVYLHIKSLYSNIYQNDLPPGLKSLSLGNLYNPMSFSVNHGYVNEIINGCTPIAKSNDKYKMCISKTKKYNIIDNTTIMYYFIPEQIHLNDNLEMLILDYNYAFSVYIILQRIKHYPPGFKEIIIKNFNKKNKLLTKFILKTVQNISEIFQSIKIVFKNVEYNNKLYDMVCNNNGYKMYLIKELPPTNYQYIKFNSSPDIKSLSV
jgi:hypothetical protein